MFPVASRLCTGFLWLVLLAVLYGCGGGESSGTNSGSSELGANNPPAAPASWYRPSVAVTWQWQLSGTINTSYGVEIYDIDLFNSPTSLIQQLHASGRKVVCYFSAGSYEEWRSDALRFQPQELGNALSGWAGERWLDIRTSNVREIMKSRLDLAVQKGCDGVEPDNVDGYTNNTGFSISASDQLAFNRLLATEAHARGLAIGLKNNLDQVAALVADFDFAVNEQCFEFAECDTLQAFIAAGKPVLNAEYQQTYVTDMNARAALCSQSLALGLSSLVLPLNLDDSFRYSCR